MKESGEEMREVIESPQKSVGSRDDEAVTSELRARLDLSTSCRDL